MNLPYKNIFETPEGYFDTLPDLILEKTRQRKPKSNSIYWYGAAAAVLVLGLVLGTLLNQNPDGAVDLEANLEPEIELYINAGYWQAEDILSLTDSPDELLDAILVSEWGPSETSAEDQEDWMF